MEKEEVEKKEELIQEKPSIRKKDINYQKPWSKQKDFAIGVIIFVVAVILFNVIPLILGVYSKPVLLMISPFLFLVILIISIAKGRRFILFGLLLFPILYAIPMLLFWGACFFMLGQY